MYTQLTENSSNSSTAEDVHTKAGSVGVVGPKVGDMGESVRIQFGLTLITSGFTPNYTNSKENVIMTNLFNAERAITAVHSEVLGFDGIIAGGVVADKYFNVNSKDIDVFVAYSSMALAIDYAEAHGFELAGQDSGEMLHIPDSYGRSRHNTRNNILRVYKGFILGYPVDIVIVEEDDARVHVDTFDLNIKRAYYDGRYHYTTAFMEDVTTGIITPNVYESTGYIRAKLAADKYGMEISPMFELSRNYVAYLKEHDHMNMIAKKYHDYVAQTDMGSYKEHVVQAADLFKRYSYELSTDKKRMKKFASLSRLMKKSVQTLHPITREQLTINIESHNYKQFNAMADRLTWQAQDEDMEDMVRPLELIKRSQFEDGMMIDLNQRTVRINKYLNKLTKKYPTFKMTFDMMSKLVETRGTKSTAQVVFSASTKDLLQISTHKGWTSCQKWYFNEVTGNNMGVLGNLGGATVVGILKDEDSKKWGGRFLVRIGEDNALWLEGIYTHRAEFGEDQRAILDQVADQLRELGYTVFTDSISGMKFKSLPMSFRPYNDSGLNLTERNGQHYFESRTPFIRSASQIRVQGFRQPIVPVDVVDNDWDGMPYGVAIPLDDDGDLPF